jgi:hypothetical protein
MDLRLAYCLINITKKQKIVCRHLPIDTAKEWIGSPIAGSITTLYGINNSGDEIGFISEKYDEKAWPYYKGITWEDIISYRDVTEEVINELQDMKILMDKGKEIFNEDEPDIYIKRLENVWVES